MKGAFVKPHIGEVLQPISDDEEVSAMGVAQVHGLMYVPHHDRVAAFIEHGRRQVAGDPFDDMRGRRAVQAAASRDSIGKGDSDIGVDESVEGNRDRAAEKALENLVTHVPGPNSIAVRQKYPPGLLNDCAWTFEHLQPNLAPQIGASPEIVVAAEIENARAGLVHVRKGSEEPEMSFGHGVAVLEPEVEDVAEQVELSRAVSDGFEEPKHRLESLRAARTASQVGVTYEKGFPALFAGSAGCPASRGGGVVFSLPDHAAECIKARGCFKRGGVPIPWAELRR